MVVDKRLMSGGQKQIVLREFSRLGKHHPWPRTGRLADCCQVRSAGVEAAGSLVQAALTPSHNEVANVQTLISQPWRLKIKVDSASASRQETFWCSHVAEGGGEGRCLGASLMNH